MKQLNFNDTDFAKIESVLEDGVEIILEEKEYQLSKTICISKEVTITGNCATLIGRDLPIGLFVTASNVNITGLTFKGIKSPVEVDSLGQTQENVVLDHLNMEMTQQMVQGIQVGSSKSNGVMRNIHIQNCTFVGIAADENQDNELAAVIPCNISAASGRKGGSETLKNCLLEDVFVENNNMPGEMRLAVNVMTAMGAEFDLAGYEAGFEDDTVRNLHIIGNKAAKCWDGAVNIVGALARSKNCKIENIEIKNNDLGFGIAGVYMYANEPIFTDGTGGSIRNVKVFDNKLTRAVQEVGEPTRALFFAAGRTDYYPNINVRDGVLEDVEVCGNTIDGAGIVFTGCYSLLDGAGVTENNVTRNINIHDNRIMNADYAFTFDGAQIEGRIYDWYFGYPRHEKRWVEDITDDSVITNEMTNNRIENLRCVDNQIDGFRYRVTASGANARGHGIVKDNQVTKDIVFENNRYGVGENHVRVADVISEDYIRDGGGNEVSRVFLKR